MSLTTKGPAARTAEPFTTDRANGPHHIPAPIKEQNVNTIIQQDPSGDQHPFVVGQYVSAMHASWSVRRTGVVVAIVPPAAAPEHDDVVFVVEYPPATDEHPAVQALAVHDGKHRATFRAAELQPVPADDAPQAVAAEILAYVTGPAALEADDGEEHPAGAGHDGDDDQAHDLDQESAAVDEPPSGMDWYECPEDACTFATGAAGPLDPDEPDDFAEKVEEHRARHARELQHDHAVTVARQALAASRDAREDLAAVPALLDAMSCPVPWCETDHTAANNGFDRDAFESFSRFHAMERGGFKLDVVEKVTAAGEHFTEELAIGAAFDIYGDPTEVARDARESAAALLTLTEVAANVTLGPVTP